MPFRLYFSGVASQKESLMLLSAGVTDWLADPVDFPKLPSGEGHCRILDSGAYRAFRKGSSIDVPDYLDLVRRHVDSGLLEWAAAPDCIGDPAGTQQNWRHVKELAPDLPIHPVFTWGAPWSELDGYAKESALVCIGGLVPLMRAKDKGMLAELLRLVTEYPRLHILGINWLRAMEELAAIGKDTQGDTSKWLDGGRYAHLIFRNTRTGHLSQAPAKALGGEAAKLNREGRCVESARNLLGFLSA